MGILEYLFGHKLRETEAAQPAPSKAGAGPDVDVGRRKTRTEKDLRRVQSQYDAESDSFEGKADR